MTPIIELSIIVAISIIIFRDNYLFSEATLLFSHY